MNRLRLIALSFAFCSFFASAIYGQIPDKYTNLKLLPKDIPYDELVERMRGFTKALGERCNFCHKGEEGQPLSTYDFASDENEHKTIARTMITMLEDINTRHLKGLGDDEKPARISCNTCHQGRKDPKQESE
jgi:hypothetical protein